MTTCKRNRVEHLKHCNCTKKLVTIIDGHKIEQDCPLRGKCCECIKYHKELGELPACYFTEEQEKTYDRSIQNFVKLNHKCTCKGHKNA